MICHAVRWQYRYNYATDQFTRHIQADIAGRRGVTGLLPAHSLRLARRWDSAHCRVGGGGGDGYRRQMPGGDACHGPKPMRLNDRVTEFLREGATRQLRIPHCLCYHTVYVHFLLTTLVPLNSLSFVSACIIYFLER